jgi:hypothetical protein
VGFQGYDGTQYFDNVVVMPIGADKGDTQAPSAPAGVSCSHTSSWSNDNTVDIAWSEPLSNGDDYYYYVSALDSEGNESNISTNPGFEQWTSSTSATNWNNTGSNAPSHIQETTNIYQGIYSAKVTFSGSNSQFAQNLISQKSIIQSNLIIVTAWVKTTTASAITITLQSNYSSGWNASSSSHTGSGNWEKLQVVLTNPQFDVGGTTTYINIGIGCNSSGPVAYIDNFEVQKIKFAMVTAPITGYYRAVNDTTPESGGTWVSRTTTSATVTMPEGANQNIYVKAEDGAGNISSNLQYSNLNIDVTDPNAVTNWGGDSVSTWYGGNKNTISITWSEPSDNLSGLDGYDYSWTTGAADPGTSKNLENGNTSYTSGTLTTGNNYYFNIRTVDNAGNWDDTYVSRGPFYVDVTVPTGQSISSIVPNSTTQLTVNAATGADAHSGLNTSGAYWFNETTGNSGANDSTSWQVSTAFVDSGLAVNTQYTYQVKLRDNVNNASNYSSTVSKYTLANTPSAPTLASPQAISMTIDVNVNGNPAATEFAIYCDTTGQYVQANGALGAGAVWQTDTAWGVKTVTGLAANTSYAFRVKARNGDNVETAWSAAASMHTAGANADIVEANGRLTNGTRYEGDGFTFVFSSDNLDSGAIAYYKYVWDTALGTAASGGTTWSSGVLSAPNATYTKSNSKTLYLHVLGYNSGNIPNAEGTVHYGPYYHIDTSRKLRHGKWFDDNGVLHTISE